MDLVLASQSSRRSELLRLAGFTFRVRSRPVVEVRGAGEVPRDYAVRLAREKAEAAEKTAREEASTAVSHQQAALTSPETKVPAILLAAVFVLSLALAVAMAGGAFSPPAELIPSLKGLITAVVAIASASGSALIGLLAPSSGKSDAGQAAA